LLQLPDHCLLNIMQCLVGDPRTLFRAARAHRRLHQAAVLAASTTWACDLTQQRVDSIQLYFQKYGQHVSNIILAGSPYLTQAPTISILIQLHNLPKLSRLTLEVLRVQMQFDQNVHGMFMTKAPIMQLQLAECVLVDGGQGLQAILSGLPMLHHLSIHEVHCETQGRMLHAAQRCFFCGSWRSRQAGTWQPLKAAALSAAVLGCGHCS
jgi:hypothetical protein